ncbi:cysteinyl leukotriene receptor 1-like [Petromyzon marinus]|uniref:Cysteinyl leukotriene receptor 1-like n=2 Tax=Petromyzon marinus TaxID=7757 RepID=A0AAJ7U1B3_PETMA|nr:cysteinyl leukotriene receptor 1-like [Petromyzon marinus]
MRQHLLQAMEPSSGGATAVDLNGTTTTPPPSLLNRSRCRTDDSYTYPVYAALYSLIVALGLPGNTVALYAFTRRIRSRGAAVRYCTNLACSDLLYILTLPLQIAYYLRDGDWPFGDALCRLSVYTFCVNVHCSIFFLTAISVSRYMSVARPVQHWGGRGGRAKRTCVAIWAFTALCSLPVMITGTHAEEGGRVRCWDHESGAVHKFVIGSAATLVGFVAPFAVIVFCYVTVVRVLAARPAVRGGARAGAWRSSRRVWALSLTVVLLFLVLFLPYHIVRTTYLFAELRASRGSRVACEQIAELKPFVVATVCMATANGCFDPVVYFFCSKHFRSFLFRLMPDPFPWRWRQRRRQASQRQAAHCLDRRPPPRRMFAAVSTDTSAKAPVEDTETEASVQEPATTRPRDVEEVSLDVLEDWQTK